MVATATDAADRNVNVFKNFRIYIIKNNERDFATVSNLRMLTTGGVVKYSFCLALV